MKLKILVASLGLAALIGTDAAAASFKGVFNTTPFFTQFGGPADNPNDVVAMTISDNVLGGVDLLFENVGSNANLGSVFIGGIVESDFETTGGGFDGLTNTANQYEIALGRGVFFIQLAGDVQPGGSGAFTTTLLSSLTASDLANNAIGAALSDPNNVSSLAFYSGAFEAIDAAVPGPAALPLMLSAVGALCFVSRRRRG